MSNKENPLFQCVVCSKTTNMVCIYEKVPLCSMECKKGLQSLVPFIPLFLLWASKRRNIEEIRCMSQIENDDTLPGFDTSTMMKNKDLKKALVITNSSTGWSKKMSDPFVVEMDGTTFLIYTEFQIRVDNLHNQSLMIDLFNFITDQEEQWINTILEFPLDPTKKDPPNVVAVSFQCETCNNKPKLHFNCHTQYLKGGPRHFDPYYVINRIMLQYPSNYVY